MIINNDPAGAVLSESVRFDGEQLNLLSEKTYTVTNLSVGQVLGRLTGSALTAHGFSIAVPGMWTNIVEVKPE